MERDRMYALPFMFSALVVGVLVAIQPQLNGILSRSVGGPLAATVVQIFVAFAVMAVVFAALGRGEITPRTLSAAPWWVYLAGVVGGLYVAAGVVIPPETGALVFFVCIVAGQLLGAMTMDHFGAFGLAVREATPLRIAGFLLVLGGAVLVLRG